MSGKRVTLDELFEELAAKNRAAWDDPEAAAKREAASARRAAQIAAEIAAGLRDEDGDLIEAEPEEDDEEDDYDPDAEPEEF